MHYFHILLRNFEKLFRNKHLSLALTVKPIQVPNLLMLNSSREFYIFFPFNRTRPYNKFASASIRGESVCLIVNCANSEIYIGIKLLIRITGERGSKHKSSRGRYFNDTFYAFTTVCGTHSLVSKENLQLRFNVILYFIVNLFYNRHDKQEIS